ncbi:MAG: hypothetical protein IKA00_02045 [Prevotella sp.]|nr:hypothetical protein [Prevotella sp.]
MLVQGTTSYIGTNVGNQVLNRMMGSYKDDMQKLCTAMFLISYIFLIITPTARKCGPASDAVRLPCKRYQKEVKLLN